MHVPPAKVGCKNLREPSNKLIEFFILVLYDYEYFTIGDSL